MAQQGKFLLCDPENQSLVPRTYIKVKGEKQPHRAILGLLHVLCVHHGTCACTHTMSTYTNKKHAVETKWGNVKHIPDFECFEKYKASN